MALHNTAANRVDYLSVRDTHTAADMLLGTAALPLIFDEVAIDDGIYTDGGFYWGLPHKQIDNTPIRPLIEAGCDTIVVVYLSPDDLSIDPRHYPGVRILPIVPANSLGGVTATLDFSNEGAARRMEQGYADGLQIFRHLQLFLDNEAQYEALWSAPAWPPNRSASSATTCTTWTVNTARLSTISMTSTGKFATTISARSSTWPTTICLSHSSTWLWTTLRCWLTSSVSNSETAVDSFLAQNSNNRRAVEISVLDALATLSPVSGRATFLREQGLLSRFMGAITGKNQQIAAENVRDVAQAQFAALRLIAAVQEKVQSPSSSPAPCKTA